MGLIPAVGVGGREVVRGGGVYCVLKCSVGNWFAGLVGGTLTEDPTLCLSRAAELPWMV